MTRTVQLSEEAYAKITQAKREGESYSQVVLRLLGKEDPRRLFGAVPLRPDFDEVMRKMREADIRRQKELWG